MSAIKKIIPEWLLKPLRPFYHGGLSLTANFYFGRPSSYLTVIGVTGTSGKSTTVQMLAHILNAGSRKCGFITTAGAFDGDKEIVNAGGLSMPGGPTLQKLLREMVLNGCSFAVIEATSEGLAQNRHWGIKFAGAVVTNLSEAHLDSHGSFEKYKRSKGKLLEAVAPDGFIGVNLDDIWANYFLNFPVSRKFGISMLDKQLPEIKNYDIKSVSSDGRLTFSLLGTPFVLNMLGSFNIYNAALAAACANMLGMSLADCADALKGFGGVSGRMQEIFGGDKLKIFVDYAPEPAGMESALGAVNELPHKRIVHIFGATGGHRDVNKRFEFGSISAKFSDVIIITNDDVYDSDPEIIAENIREGINRQPHKKVTEVLTVLDRKAAIVKALEIAREGDILIFTGKGNEQFLVMPENHRIAWDEAKIVEEELLKFNV